LGNQTLAQTGMRGQTLIVLADLFTQIFALEWLAKQAKARDLFRTIRQKRTANGYRKAKGS